MAPLVAVRACLAVGPPRPFRRQRGASPQRPSVLARRLWPARLQGHPEGPNARTPRGCAFESLCPFPPRFAIVLRGLFSHLNRGAGVGPALDTRGRITGCGRLQPGWNIFRLEPGLGGLLLQARRARGPSSRRPLVMAQVPHGPKPPPLGRSTPISHPTRGRGRRVGPRRARGGRWRLAALDTMSR